MNIFSFLPDRKFIRQSFVLSSASLFSQLFSFLGSLVLFRIYAPAEYGKYGIFVSVSAILSLIGTGQLQHAVFISQHKKETEQLISVMMTLSVFISVLTALLLWATYGQWKWISFASIYLLPLSVLSGGLFFIMYALSVSTKEFSLLTHQKIYGAIIGPLISVGIGIWYREAGGLVAGFLISQWISVFVFYQTLIRSFRFNFNFNRNEWMHVLRKFKNFPLFTLPSELINALVNQLPLILLGRYYSLEATGHYKMATTILNLPVGAISIPVGAVFKQQASEALALFKSCREIYLRTTRLLILTGLLPYLVLGLFGTWLITLVFGSGWQAAGIMIQILAGMYLVRFVVSPLTSVTQLTGHQQFALWFNVFLLIILFGLFYGGRQLGTSYLTILSGFAWIYGALYFLTYLVGLKFSSLDRTG